MQKSIFLFIFLAMSLYNCQILSPFIGKDPDLDKNVIELAESKGFPGENHTVETADGYLLGVQRIPHGKDGKFKGVNKSVVYLQHGLLLAASDWVINFPCQSLGFILADAGYDVWLGNTRGNTYSRRHVTLSPERDASKFWNYSFDEMAEFDLPATINYILNTTGEKKLSYIGHSQGTTSAFALLSVSPEFNGKIKGFIACAPVAYVGNMTSPVQYFAPYTYEIYNLSKVFGVYEFLPNNVAVKAFATFVCGTPANEACSQITFILFGYDYCQLNKTRLDVYAKHTPAGTSVKSLAHFGQMIQSRRFQKFDYNSTEKNMEKYNQTTPPEYYVGNITTRVALIWGENDKLADPRDVAILERKLNESGSLVISYRVPYDCWNHIDFVLAKEAYCYVYNKILELLTQFES